MPNEGRMLRGSPGQSFLEGLGQSPLAEAVGNLRYGAGNDPYVLAGQEAKSLGYPAPGALGDEGEAQRYESSRLASQRFGSLLPLITNLLHEGAIAPFAQGEGGPSLKRLRAGFRGALGKKNPAKGEY